MQITPEINDLQAYLKSSEVIDFNRIGDNSIMILANQIESDSIDKIDYIKRAYEYVRDAIAHSADINHDTLTYRASEVLKEKHGICFAKSHLLAALLRCKGVPTGFCYQRLLFDDNVPGNLILHGLNGVYIEEYNKWIRLDARGNKEGVNAQFSLDKEQLAFPVRQELGEEDIWTIFAQPHENIVSKYIHYKTRTQLWTDLPTTLEII